MNTAVFRPRSGEQKAPTRYFIDALVDAFAPLVTYALLHLLGVPPLVSLIVGTVVAVGTTVAHTITRKRLDAVGVLVIAEIGVSILLQIVTRDVRLLLVKPSLYSAVGAVYLLSTAFGERPLTYVGAQPMATKGDPQRQIAYARAWSDVPAFRRLHRTATLGWAGAFLADAVLRAVIVYGFPPDRAIWLANVPHLAAIVLLVGFSALVGRKAKPYVEEQVQQIQQDQGSN